MRKRGANSDEIFSNLKTSPSDSSGPGPSNTNIIADNKHVASDAGSSCFFHGHAKVQDIACVVHNDNEDAVLPALGSQSEEATEDLIGRRRGKDRASYRAGEKPLADEAGERRLMAGPTAGNDGDLGIGDGGL
ncbi:hypothetical protein CGMCC3_g12323 [Colletotrichum fructicola]|nr:uncharacterized protein CGMCC3_g12323 [Colletotrichum fructicola]KAE9571540.1 hypothetical protein CGMCC3_g12323 [Colletotrichum fructicola]